MRKDIYFINTFIQSRLIYASIRFCSRREISYTTEHAMQTEEKTPQTTPTRMAKIKPRITSPPKMNIINSVKNVVPLVLMVRANVELIASFMCVLRVRFGIEFAVFTHTVEDNHGGIDRVTDNRQHSRYERLVDIEVEGQQSMKQCEETDNQNSIMCQSHNTTHTEAPAAEAETDVNKHDKQTADNGQESVAHQGRLQSKHPPAPTG